MCVCAVYSDIALLQDSVVVVLSQDIKIDLEEERVKETEQIGDRVLREEQLQGIAAVAQGLEIETGSHGGREEVATHLRLAETEGNVPRVPTRPALIDNKEELVEREKTDKQKEGRKKKEIVVVEGGRETAMMVETDAH